jgi:poly-gamma-glutamate synthesis protein (capsule biosynthesis protein)
VFAAGDVFNELDDNWYAFQHLAPLLSSADIVFANCEGVYADTPALSPNRRVYHGAARRHGARLSEVPFHVMSCANNHVLDGGYEGLAETTDLLRGQGIQVTGAGATIAEATTPAILERHGIRFAFLGFCAVFPVGHEARADRPGLAPLRIRTHYDLPDPNMWDPGDDPIVTTRVEQQDQVRLREALASARQQADFVVIAFHWGHSALIRERMAAAKTRTATRTWRETTADYEIELARDAIDHGADAVVCHHQLTLRGMEFHRGKPIFYGLGVLVNHFSDKRLHQALGADPNYPHFPFRPEARHTGVAVLEFTSSGESAAGFIPGIILPDGSTEPFRAGDPRAELCFDHLKFLNQEAGFETHLSREARDGWAFVRLTQGGRGDVSSPSSSGHGSQT